MHSRECMHSLARDYVTVFLFTFEESRSYSMDGGNTPISHITFLLLLLHLHLLLSVYVYVDVDHDPHPLHAPLLDSPCVFPARGPPVLLRHVRGVRPYGPIYATFCLARRAHALPRVAAVTRNAFRNAGAAHGMRTARPALDGSGCGYSRRPFADGSKGS